MISNIQKQAIASEIVRLKSLGKSQNAIATQVGVSAANITQILKNNWKNISTELWQKVEKGLLMPSAPVLGGASVWQGANIHNFAKINGLCAFAQSTCSAKIIAFDAGSGKTYTLTEYSKNTPNAFYFQCERHYTKKVFLQKFGRTLGLVLEGTISDMIDAIIEKLKSFDKPLIIWDEFDKVLEKQGVFDLFKTFYDATLGYCGFVLCGTTALEQELKKRVKSNKIGYVELFSRCGREYVALKVLSKQDITQVCMVNGVVELSQIEEVRLQLGQGDLRQLKSIVEQMKAAQLLAA